MASGRNDFNARFAYASKKYPDLNPVIFSEFLRTSMDPLVQAVNSVNPDRVAAVVSAAYDAALELVGLRFIGSGVHPNHIEQGWKRVFPKMASLIADAPTYLIAAINNALIHIASTPGAHPEKWIEILEGMAPECADAEILLKAGQVAAWRAGLAQYRTGALASADTIPEKFALTAVGAPLSQNWSSIYKKLLVDPWFDPSREQAGPPLLRVVAQVGNFRGYGGLFAEPPLVASSGEHFLVLSGESCWALSADKFGAVFHRASTEEFFEAQGKKASNPGFEIILNEVTFNGMKCEVPGLVKCTSSAMNKTTIALTSAFSHSVILIAVI